MNLAAFVGDDQRAFELTHVFRVDPEVRLKRHFNGNARRDIDERATRPHCGVECRKLVVVRRNNGAEVRTNDFGMLTKCGVHIGEDDALLFKIFTVLVVHNFGFVLRGNAGKVLTFSFGNSELLVGFLH